MISLQKVKPTTPSRRQLIKLNQKSLNLSKKSILKNKIKGLKNSSGRNHSGRITVFHKGGGVPNKFQTRELLSDLEKKPFFLLSDRVALPITSTTAKG